METSKNVSFAGPAPPSIGNRSSTLLPTGVLAAGRTIVQRYSAGVGSAFSATSTARA
jgi:hypothetical protein